MIKINLLPDAKPTKKKKGVSTFGGAGRLNLMLLAGGVALGLLVILVHYLILASETRSLDDKIRRNQLEVARLESVLREVKDFEDKKTRLQKKVDLINQLKQNQKGPVRLMDEVSNSLPDLVWVESMEYKGNSISVSGKAFNPPAVGNFFTNLKKVPSFQEPVLVGLNAANVGGASLYNYRLSFVFTNLDKTQGEPAAPPAPDAAPSTAPKKAQASSAAAAPAAAGM